MIESFDIHALKDLKNVHNFFWYFNILGQNQQVIWLYKELCRFLDQCATFWVVISLFIAASVSTAHVFRNDEIW